jgi:hypothetical protein
VIFAVNGGENWDRSGKKFKIHIRVVTCQSMVVKNAEMFYGN